ncbi:hypothetical protein [Actinoplanes xinjiangensis]|uniref:Uncharacterized protein n=1 Tax=Actinoplanes xinjiangensis TaxID=512350 RepID=A0A316FBU9_9ACTN|nr:hypothetical protein [Actinoplanes xinjiangensis]PWK43421.1 hypothetical protein BC793_113103 [Actinoplanes xinjiangensis]GIF41738.1 hypothetical protein Axi01nite_60490 [Actinoplanes xinjiangensis]
MSRKVRPAELEMARLWLAGRGLADVAPTPMLAARLAVRRRARVVAAILPAAFLIAAALVYVSALPIRPADDGFGTQRRWALVVLAVLVAGLVAGLSLLDRWVRRVDQQAGAELQRRATHSVRPGWRTVLGVPRVALLAVTYAGAAVLAIAALTIRDGAARYAAVILLIGLCGVAVGTAVQLRHVLTHPVVADGEGSLKADLLMRVEDAREVAVPTVVWSLPVVSVFDTGLDPWNTGWLIFMILSVIALALITAGDARSALAAQHGPTAR